MKDKITIVASVPSTFVVRDLDLLRDRYDVVLTLSPSKYGLEIITKLLKMTWNILRSKVVITWFAEVGHLSVKICKLFGKRSVIIVAGYDVARIESIGYGALIDEKKRKKIAWALRKASAVIAVDQGLIEDMKHHFSSDFGAVVVPTGYDPNVYLPSGEKEPFVLSVCTATNKKGLVKGIDVFAECARRMPDVKFVLIGTSGEALGLLGTIPDNLEMISSLPAKDLIPYYQRAKVYCQFSMREGLPNAVCEAMLCGCLVVGSDVQGVRTAVGNHGLLVPYGDVERSYEAIRSALKSGDTGGREWIIQNFSEESRKKKLTALIDGLIAKD